EPDEFQPFLHDALPISGSSLAVDRDRFSGYITEKIMNHPNIEVIREEVKELNEDELTIIAAGPLASEPLSEFIRNKLHSESLHLDRKSTRLNSSHVKIS